MATKKKETAVRMHVAKLFEFSYSRLINEYKEIADFVIDEFISFVKDFDITEQQILLMTRDESLDEITYKFYNDVGYEAFKAKFFPSFEYEEFSKLFSPVLFRSMVVRLSCVSCKADQNFYHVMYSEEWLKSFLGSDEFRKDKKLQLTLLYYYLSDINIHDLSKGSSFMNFATTYNTPDINYELVAWTSPVYSIFEPLIYLYRELILNSLDPEMVSFYELSCSKTTVSKFQSYIPVQAANRSGEGMFIQQLKAYDIANWSASVNSAMDYDPRQYKAIATTDPKEDTSFYDENLLYFKNVAFPFFFTYIRSMNFTIDSLEKHGFFYHFGRNTFIGWVIGIPCIIAVFVFFVKMLMMTFGE